MSMQKLYFKTMDRLWPSRLAKQVYHFMSNPNIRKLRDFEEVILDRAERERVPFKGFELQSYVWGEAAHPTILLIHGWEGQAGNFGALVEVLLKEQYQVVAFDGPAHGRSSRGNTSMFELGEAAAYFMQEYQPAYLVSHSFGSIASMYGMIENKELLIKKWLLITTPHNFKDRIQGVADFLGVTDRTIDKVIAMVERDQGESIEVINVDDYSLRLKDSFEDALLVHSKSDTVLPIEDARKVQQAFSERMKLVELDKLGHYSILWSEAMQQLAADYFSHPPS